MRRGEGDGAVEQIQVRGGGYSGTDIKIHFLSHGQKDRAQDVGRDQ